MAKIGRVSLNRDEIVYLADRVLNTDNGTEEKPLYPYDLLLKIGSAYVELTGDGSNANEAVILALTENETWLLRSKVSSFDKNASDGLFGVHLLRKLYGLLLELNVDIDIPLANEEGETMTEDRRKALQRRLGGK